MSAAVNIPIGTVAAMFNPTRQRLQGGTGYVRIPIIVNVAMAALITYMIGWDSCLGINRETQACDIE